MQISEATTKVFLSVFPSTEKRVENTTHSGVFLMHVEVFRDVTGLLWSSQSWYFELFCHVRLQNEGNLKIEVN